MANPDNKIEPAVPVETWESVRALRHPSEYDDAVGDTPAIAAYLIALNNAALPDDDPRKITREKIASIRQAAHFLEESDGKLSTAWGQGDNPWHKLAADLRAAADALESYLPPLPR